MAAHELSAPRHFAEKHPNGSCTPRRLTSVLHGRDRELAAIGELLEGARAGRSGALVIPGEPGIGKTALLDEAERQSADACVLRASCYESERELPFAGLHTLLSPILEL